MTFPPSTPTELIRRHWGAVLLLAIAAAVRLRGLSDWWLNPDEGIYFSILTRADFGGFWQEVTANAHPPLYYLLLRGLAWISWDFVWLRLFSVACGVVAVAGAWAVGRRLGAPREGAAAGFVAAGLLAFAPGAIELSQVVRPYALQLALLTWALYFLLGHLRTREPRDLRAYLGLLTLAVLTHYSSALALAVFALLALAAGGRSDPEDPAWKARVAWHAVPLGVFALLYLVHLRSLSASALADQALDGWLSFYMIDAPADVWSGLAGFQHLIAHPWLRGTTMLLSLAALIVALWKREARVASILGGAWLVATAAAALGAYPFGSTRHSAWQLVFVAPAIGWLVGVIFAAPERWSRAGGAAVVAALVAFGGPLGSVLGVDRAPWAPTDRVLRRADLASMLDVVDPVGRPEVLLMSQQTYYLLIPFWTAEREDAVFSADSAVFHFSYGERRAVVSSAWDFSLPPAGAPGSPGDLQLVLASTSASFPTLVPVLRAQIAVLIGGWRPPFVDQVVALGPEVVLAGRSVPGLYTFVLDGAELEAALGM